MSIATDQLVADLLQRVGRLEARTEELTAQNGALLKALEQLKDARRVERPPREPARNGQPIGR